MFAVGAGRIPERFVPALGQEDRRGSLYGRKVAGARVAPGAQPVFIGPEDRIEGKDHAGSKAEFGAAAKPRAAAPETARKKGKNCPTAMGLVLQAAVNTCFFAVERVLYKCPARQ